MRDLHTSEVFGALTLDATAEPKRLWISSYGFYFTFHCHRDCCHEPFLKMKMKTGSRTEGRARALQTYEIWDTVLVCFVSYGHGVAVHISSLDDVLLW